MSESDGLLGRFTSLSEIINDAINGIFALYTEYLHHISWTFSNVRFYVEYLIKERTDITADTRINLYQHMLKENCIEVENILKRFPNIDNNKKFEYYF